MQDTHRLQHGDLRSTREILCDPKKRGRTTARCHRPCCKALLQSVHMPCLCTESQKAGCAGQHQTIPLRSSVCRTMSARHIMLEDAQHKSTCPIKYAAGSQLHRGTLLLQHGIMAAAAAAAAAASLTMHSRPCCCRTCRHTSCTRLAADTARATNTAAAQAAAASFPACVQSALPPQVPLPHLLHTSPAPHHKTSSRTPAASATTCMAHHSRPCRRRSS
jgi:hypothetical protein